VNTEAVEVLKDVLQGRIRAIQSLSGKDLEAVLEERNLLDALWQQCFKEPSRLRPGVVGVAPAPIEELAPGGGAVAGGGAVPLLLGP